MPFYARKSYRRYPSRRTKYTRRTRKTRKRYSKKRFFKYSSKQATKVSAPVNARETYVKLPWVKTFGTDPIGASASDNYVFLGNSLIPAPLSLPNLFIMTGDEWYSGVSEYAAFYNNYRVLGSSIRIQLVGLSSTTTSYAVCLIPIMAGGSETGSPSPTARILELNALTYDQLCMQPYAQTRIIGLGSGGMASYTMKMFRKSKSMLACKDLRDNEDTLRDLPDPNGANGSYPTDADNTWFYYFRVINLSTTASSYSMQVKMKAYVNLSGRNNWVPITVPAP